ncbi:hypothetical protein BY458DRAFT_515368 [Sporodiniella umbellata]|nr:hypothetical protein BY458DRAFT_515368 [Sporodiniella umbellata]
MGADSLLYEVVHCSSWDDDYSPEQLAKNSFINESSVEKCQGWQTPKCPEYPQDLIIHLLSGPARINKVQVLSHHFKIATRIDVYIGVLKDPEDILEDIAVPDTSIDEDNMLIEFTRLGYVCFDNNAKAQFRARELKSIKVNSNGEYIRLVIRNCHRNRLNTHDQVGILSLDILGQCISSTSSSSIPVKDEAPIKRPFDNSSLLSTSTRRTSVSSNQSIVQKYPSSNVVELELHQWSTILLRAEDEAVQNEAYQEAKTYKYLGDKLERFTKILSDLEIGKRHAVETKDYDEAEKIKDDIREIRQTAEVLLKQSNIEIVDGQIKAIQTAQFVPQLEEDELAVMDDRNYDFDETLIDSDPMHRIPNDMQHIPNDDWMIPELDELFEAPIDPESVPEPIMDEERDSFGLPIQLFGEEMIACILSIKSKCRGKGLGWLEDKVNTAYKLAQNNQLEKLYISFEEEILEDPISLSAHFINASLMLIQEAVMDSRESIVLTTISIWHQLNKFCREIHIDPERIVDWVERTFCGLLKRTGDSNSRIKEESVSLILVLAQTYSKPPYTLLPLYIGKPERIIHNHKEAKLRIELVELTVIKMGIKSPATKTKKALVPIKDLMQFVVAYLGHAHDEVRETAVKLVITISDQVGFSVVSTFIDESMKLSLAKIVKKLTDKDSIGNKTLKNDTKKTISELRALTVSARKTPTSTRATIKRPATAAGAKVSTVEKKRPASTTAARKTPSSTRATKTVKPKEPVKEQPPVVDENNICIFCDESNPEFNEDTLIKHYYQACPVLTCCPMCKVITEIPTLNEHMLQDCEKHHLIKECNRCHQAIPVEQWLQHSLKQACPNLKVETEAICPLCMVSVEPTDEGWRAHLMTNGGCPKLRKTRTLKRPDPKKRTKVITKK